MSKPTAASVIEGALAIITPPQAWCSGEFHEEGFEGHPGGTKPVAHCAIGSVDMITNKTKIVTSTEMVYDSKLGKRVLAKHCWVEDAGVMKTYVKARQAALEFLGAEARKALKGYEHQSDVNPNFEEYVEENTGSYYAPTPEQIRANWNEEFIIAMNDSGHIGSQKSVVAMFKRALKKAQKEVS